MEPRKDYYGELFFPKPDWQKDDCVYCGGMATLEAVWGTTRIRCCTKQACRTLAEQEVRAMNSNN